MNRATIAAAAAACLATTTGLGQSIPYPMMRDHILEIAHDHYVLEWYCGADNIYSPQSGARCDYTVVGWKSGMAYKWGGYDAVAGFLDGIADGDGAGDVSSSAVVSWTRGDDCSGYVSRCWKSGRYGTSTFGNISNAIAWDDLAPGDALNRPSSHIRLVDQVIPATAQVLVYETTTGVDPGRTTHRVLTRAQHDDYTPIRYDHVYAVPSMVAVRSTAREQFTVEWIGAATDGFRLYESTNGTTWTRILDTSDLPPGSAAADVAAPADAPMRVYRVTAVNGGVESAPSVAFPASQPGRRLRTLLVHGFDRAIYLEGGTGNTFLVPVGGSLADLDEGFDTVDNLLAQRIGDAAGVVGPDPVDLTDYDAVLWMLGRESTGHDTLNRREREVVTAFLEAGGDLLISGAEIAWDLVDKAEMTEESDFHRQVLKADYVADDAATTRVGGAAGTPFAGLDFRFDDGSHGTYPVDYPDVLGPVNGGSTALTYTGGTGGAAAIAYEGPIGTGIEDARVLTIGFPVETVYDDADRADLLERALRFLVGESIRSTIETW